MSFNRNNTSVTAPGYKSMEKSLGINEKRSHRTMCMNTQTLAPCGYQPFGERKKVAKLMELHSKICPQCKNLKRSVDVNFGFIGETVRVEDCHKYLYDHNIDTDKVFHDLNINNDFDKVLILND